MTGVRQKALAILLVCAGLSALWSYQMRGTDGIRMVDFGTLYYGARCAMHHHDPYVAAALLGEFQADGGRFPADALEAKIARTSLTIDINLPTAMFLAIPLAALPWKAAQDVWILLTAGLLALAALLVWDLADQVSSGVALCLAAFMLLNCEVLMLVGNLAGVAVSLCVIAAWCMLKERYAPIAVVLLGLSLVLKPHDAGLVWLFFLLSGGILRKRAVQTLAVVGIVSLLAALWMAPSSPHWIGELHRNLVSDTGVGGVNNPGLTGLTNWSVDPVVALQGAFSIVWDNPHFYNLASYLLGGLPILIWAIVVMRKKFTLEGAQLALAAIVALFLLPLYHRTHDAKLLLLTIPACAMLWAERGPRRWLALALTSAGILLTSDIPLALVQVAVRNLALPTSSLAGRVMTLFLLRPAPLVLLAVGCFYLWVFARYDPPDAGVPGAYRAMKRRGATGAGLASGAGLKPGADAAP